MKKRNSINENDDNQKNNVLHDDHDYDHDNHDIVDDHEHGNQVHEDIKYVHTIEERKIVFDYLSSLRQ